MKPLIVGEAPSKNADPERPIEGRIGIRLADCSGLPYEQFLAHFDRVNLLHVRQEVAGKGFVFDRIEAAQNAELLWMKFMSEQIVLLLGKRVASAFSMRTEYFVEQRIGGACVYVLPHPSGINRWWNDSDNLFLAGRFMRDIVWRTR